MSLPRGGAAAMATLAGVVGAGLVFTAASAAAAGRAGAPPPPAPNRGHRPAGQTSVQCQQDDLDKTIIGEDEVDEDVTPQGVADPQKCRDLPAGSRL